MIGKVAAMITTDTTSSIQVTIPSAATTAVMSVATPGGKATTLTALSILEASSFSPASGPSGTAVTISGSGFNASSVVDANGVQATVLKRSGTQLEFTWPSTATKGTISVTNTSAPVGTVTTSASFTRTAHVAPTISSFSPTSDITGASVTITGTNFSGASAVKFGTHAASFTIASATSITTTVPNGAKPGALSVTTAAGTATSASSFTPLLSITQVSPATGPAGTPVTIKGAGFTGTSTVTFNGTPASITSQSPSQLVVTVPPAAPGGPVTVTNTGAPAGTVDSAASFNPGICGSRFDVPAYAHVIVIAEENHSFADIVGSPNAPYINTVANQCGLATDYHSITHPSLPEYIAATSAPPYDKLTPFLSDCVPAPGCQSGAENIFHQAPSWKSYAESMPANCGRTNVGTYAPRHNPAVYYTDLPDCATNDVPLGTTSSSPLLNDLQSDATAPAYSWVVPNLCDDMHGHTGCATGPALIQAGDSWLKQWLPLITSTPTYQAGDTAIFIFWDEGEGGNSETGERCAASADPSCRVPAVVIAPSVPTGTRSGTFFTHYSLLRTAEDLFGLPAIRSAATAASMVAAFNL